MEKSGGASLKHAFNAICAPPNPPESIRPGGVRSKNIYDKKYLKALDEYANQKTAWLILTSLEATEDLVWETVDMSKPETYLNYRSELIDSGFSAVEINMLIATVMEACGLTQDKIEEATKSFLAGQRDQPEEVSSQNIVVSDTLSGEPASD